MVGYKIWKLEQAFAVKILVQWFKFYRIYDIYQSSNIWNFWVSDPFFFLLDQNLADCTTTEMNGKFSETVSTKLIWRHLTEERGFLTDTTVFIL